MVAKITTPARLLAALNYNENKVRQGKAKCLYAKGFLRSTSELIFQQKLSGFERLNSRNDRATTKTIHISLNFDPSEKLSSDKLVAIAEAYLKGIGFSDQPALIYQHNDAGHPHIHIVSNTIREDGSRINTHNIGRNQSEITRKKLEIEFGLVKAGNKKSIVINEGPVLPLEYGKAELRKYIQQIVQHVTLQYLFCSIPEFNAALRKFNVIADKGGENSRVQLNQGLYYRMLTKDGEKMGVPIKASSLIGKPGLKKLETLFEKNSVLKEPFKKSLKESIDDCLRQSPKNLDELGHLLSKQNIMVIFRKAIDGGIYGITFIDERNKMVINGSDLGKPYSAAHLAAKLKKVTSGMKVYQHKTELAASQNNTHDQLIGILLNPVQEFNPTHGAPKKKRKRKKRNLGL